MIGCEKIRKYLSQIKESKVTVENLTEDGDANFELTREALSNICGSILERFRDLILAALKNSELQINDVRNKQ